ncbi:MAG: FecR domain-containing protein [Planctomycetes bacterium]|nr:FecR domain-containing protein [Planctomycetota bacterium]
MKKTSVLGLLYATAITLIILNFKIFSSSKISTSNQNRSLSNDETEDSITVVDDATFKKYLASNGSGGLIREHKSNIIITEKSELIKVSDDEYSLNNGAAVFQVRKGVHHNGLKVKTDIGTITTKGTTFEVQRLFLPPDAVFISVLEGEIEYTNENISETVKEHEVMLVSSSEILFKKNLSNLDADYDSQTVSTLLNSTDNRKSSESSDPTAKSTNNIYETKRAENMAIYLEATLKADNKKQISKTLLRELFDFEWVKVDDQFRKVIDTLSKADLSNQDEAKIKEVMQKIEEEVDWEAIGSRGIIYRLASFNIPKDASYIFSIMGELSKKHDLTEEQKKQLMIIVTDYLDKISNAPDFELQLEKRRYQFEIVIQYINALIKLGYLGEEVKLQIYQSWDLEVLNYRTYGPDRELALGSYLKKTVHITDNQLKGLETQISDFIHKLMNRTDRMQEYDTKINFIRTLLSSGILSDEQKDLIKGAEFSLLFY